MTQIKIKRVYEDPERRRLPRIGDRSMASRHEKKQYLGNMMFGKRHHRLSPNSGNGFSRRYGRTLGGFSQICIGKSWKHLKPHGNFLASIKPYKNLLLCYMPPKHLFNHASVFLQQSLEASSWAIVNITIFCNSHSQKSRTALQFISKATITR